MKISLEAEIPQIPNFIRFQLPNGEYTSIPIAELTPEQLTDIGKSWTMRLIEMANHKKQMGQRVAR